MSDNLRRLLEERGVAEIVHFTSNNGLVGSLQLHSLISRRALPKEKHLAYVAAPTASARAEAQEFFNKDRDWLDFINMSISEINSSYFRFASKWHVNEDRWWVILSFCPTIATHDGVYFTTTNNIYDHVQRGHGELGFNALFVDNVRRKGPNWRAYRGDRPDRLPTCEQAELLYPSRLSLDFLRKIYVRSGENHDVVEGWLRYFKRDGVDVVIDPSKFVGVPN